jgi:hypothetical protein
MDQCAMLYFLFIYIFSFIIGYLRACHIYDIQIILDHLLKNSGLLNS